jgi:hypothetical protein
MRNQWHSVVALAVALAFSSFAASAQNAPAGNQARPAGAAQGGANRKPDEPGGPAPTHNVDGTWVGAGESRLMTHVAPMTPAGAAKLKLNSPDPFSGSSNDPWQTCDPFGMPRVVNNEVRTIGFATMPDRIIILENYGKNWREVWMDGRQLPKNVGHRGGPSSRWFGYSVGHWDANSTLVVDTIGMMAESWVDRRGYPHSVDAHAIERYERPDHNHLNMTESIDDPAYYTKTFVIATAAYKWITGQDDPKVSEIPFADEQVCVPSAAIEYQKLVGDAADEDAATGAKPAK